MLIFITGGARSGKSTFAEKYATKLGQEGLYIATAQLYDDEMRERARLHHQRRAAAGFPWQVQEEPYALAELIRGESTLEVVAEAEQTQEQSKVILVDCLTLWLSNWLLKLEAEGKIEELETRINELVSALVSCSLPLLVVSNEVGGGIVPEYPLGRMFRDWAGILNQRVAAVSQQAFLVTAGIPVDLKKLAFSLDGGNL
ncbi:MAG: bifunctional adenosylcobinamide kinase/adenosylcobinamide-phosphate guanylyltransferase [Gorillibacterium sp.]|nr:bifunctional adenosylcobinamide kinase/adenosylcobinamide-phosphate guanylyltransferase [Gorillibacterium sp.]